MKNKKKIPRPEIASKEVYEMWEEAHNRGRHANQEGELDPSGYWRESCPYCWDELERGK